MKNFYNFIFETGNYGNYVTHFELKIYMEILVTKLIQLAYFQQLIIKYEHFHAKNPLFAEEEEEEEEEKERSRPSQF